MKSKVYFNYFDKLITHKLETALNWKGFSCIRIYDYKNDSKYKETIDRMYPEFAAIVAGYLFSLGIDELI